MTSFLETDSKTFFSLVSWVRNTNQVSSPSKRITVVKFMMGNTIFLFYTSRFHRIAWMTVERSSWLQGFCVLLRVTCNKIEYSICSNFYFLWKKTSIKNMSIFSLPFTFLKVFERAYFLNNDSNVFENNNYEIYVGAIWIFQTWRSS